MSSINSVQQDQNFGNSVDNQHLNGAAIVDSKGREIMITEDMIREALAKMEAQNHSPERSSRN